uniref:Uncharacterized protein n=1 Tax=Mycena chlorophos TaxID=658473 RepID=A0ABQ0L6L7_MYCCL|nr:predicted protein [Mycena chlorophos]
MGRTAAQRAQFRAMQQKNAERYDAEREVAEKENEDTEATYPARTTTKRPSLRSQLDSAREELVSAHDALSAAEVACKQHERTIAFHKHTIASLQRQLDQSQSQIDLLTIQLANSRVQVEELASELGGVYDGLKKESAKVTRLKQDREKAKGVAGAREAALVQELAAKNASIDLQRQHTSTLDTQLAQAKLIADENRAKTKAIQAEREKYKKQAQRAKSALEHTRKTLKALQTWDPMDPLNRNMYGGHTRRLMRRLDGVGVSSKHIGKVISIVASELGVRVKRVPSARTARMVVKEAGLLSKVKLGREVALAKKIGASSDGTSIKRVTYEARHLRLRVPDYKNPAGKPAFKTMVLDLDHAHDHTAQTQFEGDMAAGAAITNAYRNSPIYDAEAAPLDPKDFLRKMRWQNMDHAADGKAKLDLTRAAKLWIVREDLAKEKWAAMEELDRFNAVCAVGDKDLEKEFSAKVVAEWSLDQRKEGREALAIQRIGDTVLKQLPEDQQRDADILFAGCMCHKDLNAFKYAVDALEAMWPRDDRPALLANKANDAVIRLSEDPSSAAVQNALESSTCGAMKLVALSAMTFRNANDITGYQQLTENFLELRKRDLYPTEITAGLVKPAQPFPDFQHCRFQTGGQGAAELFKFLPLYIELVQTVADSKVKSGDLNHVESNLLKGYKCAKTRTELAAISLYAVTVSWPYMRYARGGGSDGGGLINIIGTIPMHPSLVPFCRRLAANPSLILDAQTPEAELTIDGQPFMDPLVVTMVREHASELPRLAEAITAVFTGGTTGWTIFTEEFEDDGPIAQLTAAEKDEIDIDSTNCKNEGELFSLIYSIVDTPQGLLGYSRQQKLKNPSGTIKLFRARAMYRRNGTEDFIAAHASGRDMTVWAMREARREDGDGSEKDFRLERAKRMIAKATANVARLEKRRQEEAERRALLIATPVILEAPKLNMLTVKQLTAQMRIHWQIFKDPVLVAIPNKGVLKKKEPLLRAVKEAVVRHLIRMDNARRQRENSAEPDELDIHNDEDEDMDDGSEWGGIATDNETENVPQMDAEMVEGPGSVIQGMDEDVNEDASPPAKENTPLFLSPHLAACLPPSPSLPPLAAFNRPTHIKPPASSPTRIQLQPAKQAPASNCNSGAAPDSHPNQRQERPTVHLLTRQPPLVHQAQRPTSPVATSTTSELDRSSSRRGLRHTELEYLFSAWSTSRTRPTSVPDDQPEVPDDQPELGASIVGGLVGAQSTLPALPDTAADTSVSFWCSVSVYHRSRRQ